MAKQKIMLFNGFLGSGKTTTMVETAKYLRDKGVKVSLITNDLGENLVDTDFARLSGCDATEIPNGCLCHDVPNFLEVISGIVEREEPDYIFAEPVGSCVGLVESVYKDLAANHPDEFELLPFIVLVDPIRYRSIYMSPEANAFNEEATYMYKKQLDEADVIVLNKCDLLDEAEKEAVLESIRENYGDRTVVAISSADGDNYEEWVATFLGGQEASLRDNEIDWERLMQGDEHLGWHNSTVTLSAPEAADFNLALDCLTNSIRVRLASAGQEIAHLKVMAEAQGAFAKAALVGNGREVVYTGEIGKPAPQATFNINIRAQATPEELTSAVDAAVRCTAELMGLAVIDAVEQSFDSFAAAPEPTKMAVA